MRRAFIVAGILAVLSVSGFIVGIWTGDPRWAKTAGVLVAPALLLLMVAPAFGLLKV